MWILYELLLFIGLLLYLPKAVWRKRLPHPGWSMRLGRYPAQVAAALQGRPSVWVHAVSVGEVLAARPLLATLTQQLPKSPLVLSTVTPSGFSVAETAVGSQGTVVYFPLDFRPCIRRALAALQPRLLLLVESELWPSLIRLARTRGVPIAVVNGRVSPRTFRRWQALNPWLGGMLARVDLFLMQSRADADRLLQLGAAPSKVHVVGSLKWDASLGTQAAPEAIRQAAVRLGLRDDELVIVAGSTHRGEETAVVEAMQALRGAGATVRLILAPRHLERLGEVEGLIRRAGLRVERTSQREPARDWEVGLIDTFGQLPLYYGLASFVFIGGSLIPHGGQNPLEATSIGKPVVFGPHMHNFETITHQLLAHHGARQAADGPELTRLMQELAAHPDEARAMGTRAQELTDRFRGAAQRTLEALRPLLAER